MTIDLTDYVNTDSMFECKYVVSFYWRECRKCQDLNIEVLSASLEVKRVIWCC